jgi:hypothetical protein
MAEGSDSWDYIAEAGALWARADDGDGSQGLRDAVPYWLQTTAARSAIEFTELVAKGVPVDHAMAMVCSGADHMIAYDAAVEIHGTGYDTWRTNTRFAQEFPRAHKPPDNGE